MREAPVRVLLIEDNLGDARLIRALFEEIDAERFEVAHVDRLSAGLQHATEEPSDIILLDLSLPDSDGLQTLARMEEGAQGAPVVVLTGLDDDLLATIALQEGAQDYLVKGKVDSAALERSIRYAMERARLLRAERQARTELETERNRLAEAQEQLRRQAFYDSLTGLPNRALFMDRLQYGLASAAREKQCVGVLFLDLDSFKLVNDTLGHGAGDALLWSVAYRLAENLRPGDTVARFGGDEFTIVLNDLHGSSDAVAVAERLNERLREPFTLRGQERYITASIGIAVNPQGVGATQAERLLSEADTALYQAKLAGKDRVMLFTPSMTVQAMERMELETDLRGAVERRELRLHYQPIVDLATEQVIGMEALVRWQHPRRGLIPPKQFIPLAEETGLIFPVGAWVLEEACRQSQAWQRLNPIGRSITMSINVSARQLHEPDFVEQLASVVRTTAVDPAALKLEMTESSVVQDIDHAIRSLRALKRIGVRLAIDDFGTGYSSLSYLRYFAIDTLKVDQLFVAELADGGDAHAIVEAVTALAHALQMDVTAEGVETAMQVERLRALGCDHAQGYYFGRPTPSHNASLLLE